MAELVDVPEPLHPKKSHVCDRCLSVWPGVPYQNQGSEIFGIEETAKELLDSACEVCQILGVALQIHQKQKPSMTKPVLRWERWLGHTGEVGFYDSDGTREGDHRTTGNIKILCLEPSLADDWKHPKTEDRKYLETEDLRIDFDAVRVWLEQCSKSHDRCKFSTQQEPRNLKVIDCTQRAIVEAPVGCRYVALSYVWGGLSLKIDTNAKFLPPGLPRTIEDSIEATLLLGYQYLWVDAFCIQQDDAEDKHRQIQQMDSIYVVAELTLIAAAGDDPSFGLPGVSRERKMRNRDATVGNICVSYCPPTVHSAIKHSRWFTRGWTFQEGYLARRRLYFTDRAVLFVCNQSQEYENFQGCVSHLSAHLLDGTLSPQAFGATSDGSSGLGEIMRLIEQYSARRLSYDHDALNAISGVLNYHHAMIPPIDTLWGIPYQLAPAGQYVICINWTHNRIATRRLGFPSWSPLGWDGSVRFAGVYQQFKLSENDAGYISNQLRDGLGNGGLEENPRYLQITVRIHRFRVVNMRSRFDQHRDGDPSDHNISYFVLPIDGATGEHADKQFYVEIRWDTAPSDDYDSAGLLCAVIYDTDLDLLSMMVLQDHNTHYERIGVATVNTTKSGIYFRKGTGLRKSTSNTKSMQSLTAHGEDSDVYWGPNRSDAEEDLAWIRDIKPVTITLG